MTEVKLDNINPERYQEMQSWCREYFGAVAWWKNQLENPRTNFRWHMQGAKDPNEETGELAYSAVFIFREDKDATMFTLKWSAK